MKMNEIRIDRKRIIVRFRYIRRGRRNIGLYKKEEIIVDAKNK